jgi:hypothetical protein
MGHRVRLRLWVGVAAVVALMIVVLFPPWLVVRITPHGGVPQRVEFSFLFVGGPKLPAGGMYPLRSVIKFDWLAFEIGAVVVVTGLVLLLAPAGPARREPSRGAPPPWMAAGPAPPGSEREPHPDYQSSPGESFEQHAARLARVWGEPTEATSSLSVSRAASAEEETRPAAPPGGAPCEEESQAQLEYQSSPGEPFDQHAARLKRLWRQRRDGEPREEKDGEE